MKAFLALLNIHPHDPGVLRELVPLLTSLKLYPKAAGLYLNAFDHFQTICPHVDDETIDQISSFTYADLETISDILNHQEQFVKTVAVIRTGVRWLQGREKETGWDALHDDREYDTMRKTRDGWERDARYLEEAPVYELDVRLRLRLGVARMGEGKIEEAQVGSSGVVCIWEQELTRASSQRHFAVVLQEDVAEFPELFGTMGDAYFNRKMYDDALDTFQIMAENEEVSAFKRLSEKQR